MIPARIKNADYVLGAPVDWRITDDGPCLGLPVRRVELEGGRIFLVSAWEPTPQELEAIKNGETIKLWIQGGSHPVVKMSVGDIE